MRGRLVTIPEPRGKLFGELVSLDGGDRSLKGCLSGDAQVSTNDVLKHGTFTARLTSDDDYLRQIDRIIDTDGRKDILQSVDESKVWVLVKTSCANEIPQDHTYLIRAGSEIPPSVANDSVIFSR